MRWEPHLLDHAALPIDEVEDGGTIRQNGSLDPQEPISLTVLAYNLKRVLNLVGVPRLLAAIA